MVLCTSVCAQLGSITYPFAGGFKAIELGIEAYIFVGFVFFVGNFVALIWSQVDCVDAFNRRVHLLGELFEWEGAAQAAHDCQTGAALRALLYLGKTRGNRDMNCL